MSEEEPKRWKILKSSKPKYGDSRTEQSYSHYSPKKQREMSNSKIFVNSKSRNDSNASFQHYNKKDEDAKSSHSIKNRNSGILRANSNNLSKLSLDENQKFETNQNIKSKNTERLLSKETEDLREGDINREGFEMIRAIRNDFEAFKMKVQMEIKRQQDYINKMIKEIFAAVRDVANNNRQQRNQYQTGFTNERSSQNQAVSTLERVKSQPPTSFPTVAIEGNQQKWEKAFNPLKTVEPSSYILSENHGSRENVKFGKFFEAMDKLKKDITDLHQISMLASCSPLNSPKEGTRPHLNILKQMENHSLKGQIG